MASISWTLPTTITIADAQGRPASGAYVRFHYVSNVLNFVHPIKHLVRGSVIVTADAEGRVSVPFRIHFRRPLPLMTPASLYIDDIVVPRLHNAFGPIAAAVTRPGAFEVDASRERVTVFDVSGARNTGGHRGALSTPVNCSTGEEWENSTAFATRSSWCKRDEDRTPLAAPRRAQYCDARPAEPAIFSVG